MTSVRAGADIGGTFTDIVVIADGGGVLVAKVASTPDDYGRAVIDALAQAMQSLGIKPAEVSEVSHGFTVATNAILERRGERTALITTQGFRDVLGLARIRTPRLYDLYYRKPVPLVERRLRLEVKERVNFQGEVVSPLEMADVQRAADFLTREGIRSVAISLIHSYANPEHENRIASLLNARIPDLNLSVSSSLLPEMGEYERTSTTVINAYVRPVVSSYLSELERKVYEMGIRVPLTVMQSSGGLTPVPMAAEKPVYCVESGPAAGVVAAYHLGRRLAVGGPFRQLPRNWLPVSWATSTGSRPWRTSIRPAGPAAMRSAKKRTSTGRHTFSTGRSGRLTRNACGGGTGTGTTPTGWLVCG